jgi:transcriptional regulator with XRE-family HTH domain
MRTDKKEFLIMEDGMKHCTPEEQRKLRELAGLSQHRLALASGVHATRVCLYESGLVELTEVQKGAIGKILLRAVRARAAAVNQVLARINEPVVVEVAGRGG